MADDGDDLSAALSTRHIAHSRFRSGGRKGKSATGFGKGSVFDPTRTLGLYQIHHGSKSKLKKSVNKGSGKNKSRKSDNNQDTASASWLEIHEFTPEEDGLIGIFEIRNDSGDGSEIAIRAIFVLAGSRKVLSKVVRGLEADKDGDEQEDSPDEEGDTNEDESLEQQGRTGKQQDKNETDIPNMTEGDQEEEDDDDNDDKEERETDSSEELEEDADCKLNRRAKAFEKNSFRNPKFWMRWKGQSQTNTQNSSPSATPQDSTNHINEAENEDVVDSSIPTSSIETNTAYIIFTGNDCQKFQGTISCEALGWDNMRIEGWKSKSKARRCPLRWGDF